MTEYKAYYMAKDGFIIERSDLGKGDRLEYMRYHEPREEGERHYIDVLYNGGKVTRYFDPDIVCFNEDETL